MPISKEVWWDAVVKSANMFKSKRTGVVAKQYFDRVILTSPHSPVFTSAIINMHFRQVVLLPWVTSKGVEAVLIQRHPFDGNIIGKVVTK